MSQDHTSGPERAQRILETDFVKQALDRLTEALGAREPFLLVTGETGTGKTTLVRAAIERWGERATVAFVADPAMSRNELLEEIVRRFGAEPPANASKPQLIASLEGAVAQAKRDGRVPVVVIDDAHEISPELLGALRLLVNAGTQAGGPLEIVLAGWPALEVRLAEPAFEALRQRVGVHVVTQAFSAHQSRRFVHEIVAADDRAPGRLFPKKTCHELHAFTGGLPRTLQTLAVEAQRRAGKAGDNAVSPRHVAEAASALGLLRGKTSRASVKAVSGENAAHAEEAAAPPAPEKEIAPVNEPRTTDVASDAAPDPVPASPETEAGPATRAPAEPRPASAPDHDHAPIPRPPHDPETDGELKPPGDPKKVSDWVGRFISPEEPRFGDLIGTGRAEFVDEFGATEISEDPAADEVLARLRRRRGRILPRYRRHRRPEWLGTVALLLVIAAALVTLAGPTRRAIVAGMNAMSASAERSNTEQTARVAEEKQEVVAADAGEEAADAQAAEPAKPVKAVKAEQKTPASAPARTRTAPAEPYQPTAVPMAAPSSTQEDPNQLWAVDVGRRADSAEADMERERLVAATGLKGWLVASSGGGYRVVLGIYSTHDRAETGVRLLIGNGLVTDATVIPLPPRSQRQ